MGTRVVQQLADASAEIQELYKLLSKDAPVLIGPNREPLPLPEPIQNILLQAVGYLIQGKGVSVVPVTQELTTQQAANLLGVSRPFLIELLNQEKIPFHKTGTHRRIYRTDVTDYMAKRDKERKRILREIAKQAVADGDYDQIYAPVEGG